MGIIIKKYVWILSLLFVVAMSYLIARTASLFIASYFPDEVFSNQKKSRGAVAVLQGSKSSASVEEIIQRNFFDAKESQFGEQTIIEDDEPKTPEKELVYSNDKAVKTSLDMTLISTVVFGNGENEFSSCIVNASRKSEVYVVGDALSFPQTKIVRILPDRIEFFNKGRLEYAEIPEEPIQVTSLDDIDSSSTRKPKRTTRTRETEEKETDEEGIKQDGTHFVVKNSVVQEAFKNPQNLTRQVRVMAHYDKGQQAGFKFYKVSRRSVFHKLGIRRGDVVKAVNGRVLNALTGLQTFGELKDLRNFELELMRKGTQQKFTYEVVD